jgi:translation initiation factor IF-2
MRARGASVTDIVILVVAADDGVMPQTIEAINHAKVANVPIVVAINKIDKPGVNPDKVKQDLASHGLVPEEWGGDTNMVEISAKTGQGVDELLEMVLLQAEMLDLKADPTVPAKGTILEARLDTKRGVVATVIVQEGILKRGDAVVAGLHWGKIRALFDHAGKPLAEAGPSVPAEVLGLSGVPMAGEAVVVVENERKAREISQERKSKERDSMLSRPRLSLEEMMRQLQEGKAEEMRVVLKADVHGSLEAVRDALERAGNEEVAVKVIHGGVGGITESDILLAAAANAIVVGFNVRPDSQARNAADRENVEVRLYRVIYDLLDDVKKVLEGMLGTETQEEVVGRAEIREVFSVPKIGKVAGCYVLEGTVQRTSSVRLIRDGVVIHEGKLASLKRFKDDVKEVAAGYECGMHIEGFQDIKAGDIIEAYTTHEVARKLEEAKS